MHLCNPIFLFSVLLLIPSVCHAWGAPTHIEFAGRALAALPLLAPLVRRLLRRHEDHFLYGSLAADITLGKDLHGAYHNCHNWRVALDLYHNRARTDSQKAFMIGYLAHLAADTVSHNYFVPFKMILSFRSRLLTHIYWEMQMDVTVPERYWRLLDRCSGRHFDEDDLLLSRHLKRTFFSFRTNKRIFSSLILFQRLGHYRRVAERVVKRARLKIDPDDVKNYKRLIHGAVIDFLKNLEKSYVLDADPTGELKMLYAKETVRKVRRLVRNGRFTEEQQNYFFRTVKRALGDGIYDNTALPTVEEFL